MAFFSVSALSDPLVPAGPIVQVLHPTTASLRRSRRRAWKVSHRPPIPTALLSMTIESVPAGTTLPVDAADPPAALRADGSTLVPTFVPTGRGPGLPSARIEDWLPCSCCVVGVMLRSVSARCITGWLSHFARYRVS